MCGKLYVLRVIQHKTSRKYLYLIFFADENWSPSAARAEVCRAWAAEARASATDAGRGVRPPFTAGPDMPAH